MIFKSHPVFTFLLSRREKEIEMFTIKLPAKIISNNQ